MPIYEYACVECGEKFDRFVRSMNSCEETTCPKCGSAHVKKAFSVFGFSGTSMPSGASAASCAPTGG